MKNIYKLIFILAIISAIVCSCQSYEIRKGDTGIEIGDTEQPDLEKKVPSKE
ncbi:MAG: hypothetical protein HUU50_01250 [Candidatus Brocadiae bacterium]|nr:hypothetical protein [Candidatus Brocadiia bacterium]